MVNSVLIIGAFWLSKRVGMLINCVSIADSRIRCQAVCMQHDDCYAYNSVKSSQPQVEGCQLISTSNFVTNTQYDAVINDKGKMLVKLLNLIITTII